MVEPRQCGSYVFILLCYIAYSLQPRHFWVTVPDDMTAVKLSRHENCCFPSPQWRSSWLQSISSWNLPHEILNAMIGIVRELYKRLLFAGRTYPQGLDYIRGRVKEGDHCYISFLHHIFAADLTFPNVLRLP